jgi:hypothetical protein
MATMTAAQRRRYDLLYESCLCRPPRKAVVAATVKRISANRKRYEKVGKFDLLRLCQIPSTPNRHNSRHYLFSPENYNANPPLCRGGSAV